MDRWGYAKHSIKVIQGLYQHTRVVISTEKGKTAPITINW